MEKKYTNIKERLLYYAKNQSISIEKFLDSIDITYGSFKGKAKEGSLNSTTLVNIYTKYPNINIDWLLTGNGEMLRETFTLKPTTYLHDNVEEETNNKDYLIDVQKKLIEKLEKEVKELKEQLEQALKEKA